MTIGEVASVVGLRPSAIRYYEETGLMRPATRVSGRRRYDEQAVDHLLLIGFCQRLGFTLAEIRQLLTPAKGQAAKERWRELVDDKLDELEAAIARARQMKRVLQESRDCGCVSLDACRFVHESAPRGDANAAKPRAVSGTRR